MNHLGKMGEDLAAEFLKKRGCKIIERNCRKKFGEIDIIMLDKNELVFVEVKTRTSDSSGFPLESVTVAKQNKIRNLASIYSQQHSEFDKMNLRFDCIGILKKGDNYEIEHIEDAF